MQIVTLTSVSFTNHYSLSRLCKTNPEYTIFRENLLFSLFFNKVIFFAIIDIIIIKLIL